MLISNKKNTALLSILILIFNSLIAQINLTDIWQDYKFYPHKPNVKWLNDSCTISFGNKVKIKPVNPENDILALPEIHNNEIYKIEGFFASYRDTSIIGLVANSEYLYRHSHKSFFILHDTYTDSTLYVSIDKVYNPSFSSDLRYVAYTDENNLYVFDLHTHVEEKITHDGEWNKVINGRTDWVNEEEFGFSQAYYWIPETHKIAYLRYDETDVPTAQIIKYNSNLDTEIHSYKYPKAGQVNSKITLNIFDFDTKEDQEIFETDEEFEYVSKIGITNMHDEMFYIRTNRKQNKLELVIYNTALRTERIAYTEESEAYVETPEFIQFFAEEIVLDSYRSEGRRHLLHVYSDSTFDDLTPGNFDITSLVHHNFYKGITYFTAKMPNTNNDVLASAKYEVIKVLSKSQYHTSAVASPQGKYAILTESNLHTPYHTKIVKLKTLKKVHTLESNKGLSSQMKEMTLGKTYFYNVKSDSGHTIPCMQINPPFFDSTKTYPVLMHTYGGPGHNVVSNEWNSFDYFYHQMIAQKNCIVVLADGRGTNGKGQEYKEATYGQLGNLEFEDQLTVAKYLRSQNFVDSTKIGIWGWSFGGYLSSLCILRAPDVFSTAIAVAPVTNWRRYDNIYTERYMGLLSENANSYDANSPTSFAANLKGNFLLIHGTADDNVHVQNSYALQNELLKYNKQFETFYYFNKNHGIYGGSTRLNLYQKMSDYLDRTLLLNVAPVVSNSKE